VGTFEGVRPIRLAKRFSAACLCRGRGCGKNRYQGGRRKGSRSRSKACQQTLGLDRRFDVRGRK
jgi:hypothetical protein